VLLLDQDRARWDHLLIRRGLAAIDGQRLKPGFWDAAGPICTSERRCLPRACAIPEETDWATVVGSMELAGSHPRRSWSSIVLWRSRCCLGLRLVCNLSIR
jgi:hypothetical protein